MPLDSQIGGVMTMTVMSPLKSPISLTFPDTPGLISLPFRIGQQWVVLVVVH